MKENEIKTCNACLHFVQHYVIMRRTRLGKTECGHCVYKRCRTVRPATPACARFESPENSVEAEKTQSLLKVFSEMREELKKLALILSADR